MRKENITVNNMNDCVDLYLKVFSSPPWNEDLDKNLVHERLTFLLNIPDANGEKFFFEDKLAGFWLGYIEPVADIREMVIKEVLVEPGLQGKGIGSKILESAELYGKNNNCKYILLPNTDKTKPAYDFYIKNNYVPLENPILMLKSFKD